MDGIHDMGGMHGLGPIEVEANEPVFHHEWEARMFGISEAATRHPDWSTDYFRHTRECMPADLQLTMSYYEQWHYTYAVMFLEAGMLSEKEILTGKAAPGTVPRTDTMEPGDPRKMAYTKDDSARPLDAPPAFALGAEVVARNIHPPGHTRLPRYARGKRGRIRTNHGGHVLPDSRAHGPDENPQHLYSVEFTARELWGPGAAPKDKVYLDLWESYLELA
ncbi:MAG: nitrile hydratase subunit beta [Proteobacteria bacterium]|nr:nitrile hydratase subunit beta [Pseudomonadota bacterium]